ncbi:MAG: molybdopterin-synthase adenylyltransferase MoeB [Sedimentisphaerales bacterium]|nr:molybdopterin-synthase adenylyltransferase MoeB [Sedimentisphaerales bacterium]
MPKVVYNRDINCERLKMALTKEQRERYSRHIMLAQVGEAGQQKLLSSKVLLIGAGGLGSPAAVYLTAAGIGTIGIADSDKVDLTNLQRQIIHHTSDLGVEKVKSAQTKMQAINPDVSVKPYHELLKADNIRKIIREYDFVIDATDNFPSKFLINDACFFEQKPFSHAGVLRFDGQLMTVLPGKTACYRCVFHSLPSPKVAKSCSRAGILGVLPGVIGTLQATETIKYLLGIGSLLTDNLLIYNALTMEFRKVRCKRNPDCPLCGQNPSITELKDDSQ